jgi:DNA-binding NarL/FixJ family response regulator
MLASLRTSLGDAAFASAWSAGRALSLDQALVGARALVPPERGLPLPPPAYPDGLTPREVEVLGLIAAGLSNREIAETLVVSERTVERHADNIYGKIGARGRSNARRYARHHGLVAAPPAPGT